jgi:uncharacterized protein
VRWVLFSLGWVSFALGFIGAFLPVLPTTPFLLLSAWLFSKSSPRFHAWLLALPMAGDAIRDWDENQVIRPGAKFLCVFMLTISVAVIWYFAQVLWGLKLVLTLIIASVGTFVVTRKSA